MLYLKNPNLKNSTRLLALAALLFVSACSGAAIPTERPAELPSPEPFLNANVVYIWTDDAPQEALDNMASIFQLQGFQLSQEETAANTIITEPGGVGGGSVRYAAEAVEVDGRTQVRVTGRFVQRSTSDRFTFEQYTQYPVSAGGERRSPQWLSWRQITQIARSYEGGEVLYDQVQ